MDYLWAALLLIAILIGWVMTLLSLPGNWLMIAAAALFAFLIPPESSLAITWPWVVGLVVLALLGELAELVAGALGVASGGGSKRGAALAVVGSVVGGMLLVWVGLPVPIIGPVVAAFLGAALGALGGAMLGEAWKGRSLGESWEVGQAAFWGRLLGSVAKVTIASAMVIVTIAAMPL